MPEFRLETERLVLRDWQDGDWEPFFRHTNTAAVMRWLGGLLGFCGLKRANMAGGPMGDFEVGWRLREDAWGRGYAREAAIASLDAAFDKFAAPHLIALTVAENTASWGLMERLGMRRRPELDFRCPDFLPERDTIGYSIGRDEWSSARSRAAG